MVWVSCGEQPQETQGWLTLELLAASLWSWAGSCHPHNLPPTVSPLPLVASLLLSSRTGASPVSVRPNPQGPQQLA